MARTESLRSQHQKLLLAVGDIGAHLAARAQPGMAEQLRKKISALIGQLQFHLISEEKVLYPALLNSTDANAREMANKFIREMGGLGQTVLALNDKWTNAYIHADPGFPREWQQVQQTLADRIQREDNELYPLADVVLG